MLDDLENLRGGEDTDASLFLDELALDHEIDAKFVEPKKAPPPSKFLGMTPAQRFLLTIILFFLVNMWGIMFLMLFNKIKLF